ncbi:histidine phosphatase family protein [Fulvivirga sp. M361]|uniref:histidine phosphatase family protein n=1 Tax=Fulvivirga sp. M361 TaxID=2594266 RepID=UPI00117BD53E|nr:histidine phosphatase family protein [Fulvivirga sp. M361]TRX49487.1 histidine phosphatase family protein [Fulvivirga sp. M361]
MKTKKIYLVRHGQTDYNYKGIVQGSGIDADLNERGQQQAVAFYDAFKNVPFDKVYTSALRRTVQSVKRFISDVPHESLAALNEISWGTREGLVITPEEDAYYYNVIKRWQNGETDLRIEGGESPQDVYDRQKLALDHILAQEEEHTILICMHGRAMRVLLCQILNYPLKSMDMFEHSNLCLYQLNYTGSMFTVEKFNDVTHLKELATI